MTIRDIAERCGVSISTVSRVLNNHPDVRESVRERVLEVVQEAHYVPNNSARDLVRPPSDSIGLVVRGVGNLFFPSVIHAIEQAADRAGYTLVLHQIRSGEDELMAGASLARSKRLRGLVLLGGCFDYTPEQTAALDIPFVCCTYTNRFGTLPREAYSSVSIDDEREAYRAVSLLTERGHRTIGVLLDSVEDHSISQLRYRGYCQALSDAGLWTEPELVEETHGYDMAKAYEGCRRLIRRRPDITALFAVSDAMAVAAMKALQDEGRRIPEDCSLIAIDGIEISAYTVPTLTTLIQPQAEMGAEAVALLLDMIEGRTGNCHQILSTTIRPGGTVRTLA